MYQYKPEGALLLTPENIAALKNPAALQEAFATGKVLEGRAVVCDYEHNLIVDLGGLRGIIPRSEGALGIEDGSTRDIAIISRVNKPVCFTITDLKRNPDGTLCPILSRAAVQRACQQSYVQKLRPGDVIGGTVTHLEPFGCFVDIGCGISSLIPIDAISVSRISHPSDRFKVGQSIRAVVKGFDDARRLILSHKELLGTWEENAALYTSGETVAGIVRSVEDYGVFVEITPNLAGLAEPCPGVVPGQHASVYIKSLIPEKMKVKLIIVDAFEASYQPAPTKYFITATYMDRWQYSPTCADRMIETVFA